MVVLDRLRSRIDAIDATTVDEDVRDQLELMRDLLATATIRLRTPTRENLSRIAARVKEVTQQLEAMTQVPHAIRRRSRTRQANR